MDCIQRIDNNRLISVGGNKCILWNIQENKKIWEAIHHQKSIVDAGYIRSCNRVITCGLDSIVKFIDADVNSLTRLEKQYTALNINILLQKYPVLMMAAAMYLAKQIAA